MSRAGVPKHRGDKTPGFPRKGKPPETVGRKTTGLRRKPRRRRYRKEKWQMFHDRTLNERR